MTATVQQGQEYETLVGERLRITNERGDEVCVYYPDREGSSGHWRPRSSVEAQVEYEGMELVDGPGQGVQPPEDEDQRVAGEWIETPRCRDCGRFMRTAWDGQGLPVASCQREGCDVYLDDQECIAGNYFREA